MPNLYLFGVVGLVIAGLIYFLVKSSKGKGRLEERQYANAVVAEQIKKAHEEDIESNNISSDDKRDRMRGKFSRR